MNPEVKKKKKYNIIIIQWYIYVFILHPVKQVQLCFQLSLNLAFFFLLFVAQVVIIITESCASHNARPLRRNIFLQGRQSLRQYLCPVAKHPGYWPHKQVWTEWRNFLLQSGVFLRSYQMLSFLAPTSETIRIQYFSFSHCVALRHVMLETRGYKSVCHIEK